MLLIIVRQGANDFYQFLHETFAGQPVYLLWDRRVGERRRQHKRLPLDERRGERRHRGSPVNLPMLPFIAVDTQPPS